MRNHFCRHHVKELLEVNAARSVFVNIGNHLSENVVTRGTQLQSSAADLIYGLIFRLKSERLHSGLQLLGVDRARAI
jgi:hypothetical protein